MNRFLLAAAAVAALVPALAQAQVTPTVRQAATREVEFPSYAIGGAMQLFDSSGNVVAPLQAGGNIGNTSFAAQFSTNNANATPHLCGSTSAYKHITSGTDTQLLAASGSTTIYICDVRFSASAALNFYLEKSSTGTCGSPTQIDILITAAANEAHLPSNAFYQGLNTGASQQLCVNTSAGNLDISVIYDQY